MANLPGSTPGPRPDTITVTVTIHAVDIETGLWCRDCALPSGGLMSLELRTLDGKTVHRLKHYICIDCGRHNIEPPS